MWNFFESNYLQVHNTDMSIDSTFRGRSNEKVMKPLVEDRLIYGLEKGGIKKRVDFFV